MSDATGTESVRNSSWLGRCRALTAETAAAAIWWVPVLVIGPGFYVDLPTGSVSSYTVSEISAYRVQGVEIRYVLEVQPLNRFVCALVLPNAAQGDSQAIVELGVGDTDIGAVGFHGNAVVPIIDGPIVESDIGREECIGAIRVGCAY